MNIYQITVPIYAATEQEADAARIALHNFVSAYSQRGIPVTAAKVTEAIAAIHKNRFAQFQLDRFLKL